MSHNCRLKIRQVAGHTAYFFLYNATRDMSFDLSTLAEVGQPFVPIFQKIIAHKNLKLKTIHIEEKPWVITVEDK